MRGVQQPLPSSSSIDPVAEELNKNSKRMERKVSKDAAAGANNNRPNPTYEDFEPVFKWNKEEGQDSLELHLQDFKKEQLKVLVNSQGTILVDGERPLDDKKLKWKRFHKEFKLSREHISSSIRAKFGHGILHITVPKTKSPYPQLPPINSEETKHEKTSKDGKQTTKTDNDQTVVRNSHLLKGNSGHCSGRGFGWRRAVQVSLVAAAAMAVGVGAYLTYKYWFSVEETMSQTVSQVFPPS